MPLLDKNHNPIERSYPEWLQSVGWTLAGVVILVPAIIFFPFIVTTND
jgi:hypothetical protein